MSGQCIGGKRRQCCGEYVQLLEDQNIKDMDPVHQAISIMKVLPTRFDDSKNDALRIHYARFIKYIQDTPNTMFFPAEDN
jgi:type III secretory pathway lipoprotein EscJ